MIRFRNLLFILLSVFSLVGAARADAPVVTWPQGWRSKPSLTLRRGSVASGR